MSDSDDQINLIETPEESDYYYLKIHKDTKNRKFEFKYVKVEFNDHFCVYYNDILVYEISYYNILCWKYSKKLWGINYKDLNKEYSLFFKLEDNESEYITNSIKKRVNELIEYTNVNKEKV